MNEKADIGYLRYYGEKIENGYFDPRKTANALIGFDEAIRFYIHKMDKNIDDDDFELRVKVEEGSLLIALSGIVGFLGLTYASAAIKKIANNDFDDVTSKDILTKCVKAIIWVVRVTKHLGNALPPKELKTSIRNTNGFPEIGIYNDDGDPLWLPKEMHDLFMLTDPNIFKSLASPVDEEVTLQIGTNNVEQETTTLDHNIKKMFFKQINAEDDILFPELRHGQAVLLHGILYRGNIENNDMGFKYKDNKLNCTPLNGSVAYYKKFMYSPCIISVIIDRRDNSGDVCSKKPKLIIKDVKSVDFIDSNPTLFDNSSDID